MSTVVDTTITPTWLAIYEVIRQHWIDNGFAPSQSEIMREVGCSMASIQNAFRVLSKNGHVTAEKFSARSIKPVDLDRKLARSAPDPWDDLDERSAWER